MKKYTNLTQCLRQKELDARYFRQLQQNFTVTENFVNRLGLYGQLDGHTGCVNCLEWNENGRLLASGSDDVHVNIWDPFRKKQLASITTGHQGNIFSVKFMPNSGDSQIISGAADHNVHTHDITASELLTVCSCHSGRVKRLAIDRGTPHLFWSAGEDGLILQHDIRTTHTCTTVSNSGGSKPANVLIDLKSYMGSKAETKCLAINPVRSEMMAVGANDPFVRVYDRRMIKVHEIGETEFESSQVPRRAVQYFVPGHLPTKVTEYKRKYRSLASTYVSFSPDGTELLVNLGGEQIYLFPVSPNTQNEFKWFSVPECVRSDAQLKEILVNNGYKNGHTTIPSLNGDSDSSRDKDSSYFAKYFDKVPLPAGVDIIKTQANEAFERKHYGKAIHLYNEALRMYPDSPLLIGNRGAALLKRAWDGDVYASLRDCWTALSLDPNHFKAHLRLCRCLFELSRFQEALTSLNDFKARFPMYIQTQACKSLETDLTKALKNNVSPTSSSSSLNSDTSNISSMTASSSSTATSSSTLPPSPLSSANDNTNYESEEHSGPTRNFFIRFSSNSDSSNDNIDIDNESELGRNSSSTGIRDGAATLGRSPRETRSNTQSAKKVSKFHEIESEFQGKALDFTERYCGHCNTTTDIKEANFFGNFVVAGSDDGSFFIWDRNTTNIVKVLRGDESIVNCLQPHPSSCFMATSGIETVIRLWAPLAEEGIINDRDVDDWTDVASANQKRMNTNPFEMILMNMGYRVTPDDDPSDSDERPQDMGSSAVQCNST